MDLLPILSPMQCDDDCGECCRAVLVTEEEFVRVQEYAKKHGLVPKEQGSRCPWYQEGNCAVYPVRPSICGIFGHVELPELTCCRGYNTNISEADAVPHLKRQAAANRLLHEVLDNWLDSISRWYKLPKKAKSLTLGQGEYQRTFKLSAKSKKKRTQKS